MLSRQKKKQKHDENKKVSQSGSIIEEDKSLKHNLRNIWNLILVC